ncbi:primase 1 [Blautia hydrogenotrophica CAG:147]|uniref:YfjI family protein n=1 Tax=Blautia hydrogenotrophica TaxID=53443 RepID=UPI00033D1A37|nr:YfjI family protein [Blautia hydrogenotrophica]CCX58199.1 primase 1 [Blautia hydrogenotrophica CAG:147]CUM90438.1 Uncharacterised protein [Blautia hydrogenotrophica]SCH54470.1 Uncharacterised protein [uncultured Blautia sp.]DAH91704.1 MAG TPA: Protein of unknown function (DUF3987) [Bacteriophage sp.]
MTPEQFAAEITVELDESGIIPFDLIEDNLSLIFEYFAEWSSLLESDVLKELMTKLEDPTAVYHERVEEFSWQQRKKLIGPGKVIHSVGFEVFEGFGGTSQNENLSSVGFVGCQEGAEDDFSPEWFPGVSPFIRAVAESIQVSTGMVSPAVLAATSMALMKKFIVHLQGNHEEPPNLYIAVIAEASERKSPVMKEVTKPVYDYEKEENEKRAPEISEYNLKKKLLERRLESMMKSAANMVKKRDYVKEADIIEVQRELDELEVVSPITLIVDDITAEALIKLMSDNGEKMAVMSTEGGLFGNIAGRYSDRANMDIYLKGYSGDPLSVDRVGRKGQSMYQPLLTVLIYAQPIVLKQIMENTEFTGRGLLARFLYTRPLSMIGRRKREVIAIPKYIQDEFCDVLHRLMAIPTPEKPIEITLDEQADKIAGNYFYEMEHEILKAPSPEFRAWVGKHYGTTMRIALCLHCMKYIEDSGNHQIDKETMQNAVEMGRYFLRQAKKVFTESGLMTTQEERDALYIMSRIDSTGKMEMRLRDLYQMCKDRKGMEKKEGMIAGLNCLIKHGYVRVDYAPQNPQKPQKGGRPSEIVYVNPEYIKWKEEYM